MVYELGRSYFEMGLLLKKAGDRNGGETNLQQAKAIFQKLGAEPDLDLTMKALAALSSGAENDPELVRVTPASDVLLMQRLIEASASRELLVQELANVVYDNFAVDAVAICKFDDTGRSEPLVVQGLSRADAIALCGDADPSTSESVTRRGDVYIIRIGTGSKSGILMNIRGTEPLDVGRLQPLMKTVELGLEMCALRATARREPYSSVEQRVQIPLAGFIVGSRSMFDVLEKIHKIRTSGVTVLITGESGTGKELVARAIHAESARARAIFLPFNCTATPKEIIDSQLFGHRRGAFTGATTNYPGTIRAADGGTLFLDEIGDLSLEVQPKLMRFLQESEIQPLGEVKPIRVDVRVLAATNTDLERAVEDGRFREDLFHRLNIIRIHVPPLRQRREEVPVLANHFLEHFSSRAGRQGLTLSDEALEAMSIHAWPGNVRQLRNEIERLVAYASDGARITVEDLSPEISNPRPDGRRSLDPRNRGMREPIRPAEMRREGYEGWDDRRNPPEERRVKLKEATAALERDLIRQSLARNKNNLSRTAIDLGLSRRGLRLKLAQLGIERDTAGVKPESNTAAVGR
jgi:DNA-binding NtrC family response regulator